MAHLTTSIEYGIHCLLWLVDSGDRSLSSRDLAELQGVSPSFVAKIFPKLEKAGIVASCDGVRGGYRLARPPEEITFLQVIDAIEGVKPLFDCKEIRGNMALFKDCKPAWALDGVCAVHAIMLKAEKAMRAQLADNSLADVAVTLHKKAPEHFQSDIISWMDERATSRACGRPAKKPPG